MKKKFIIFFAILYCVMPGCQTKKMLLATFSGTNISGEFICPTDNESFFVISSASNFQESGEIDGEISIYESGKLLQSRRVIGYSSFDYVHNGKPVIFPIRRLDYKDGFRGGWGLRAGMLYRFEFKTCQTFENVSIYLQFEDSSSNFWLWLKPIIGYDKKQNISRFMESN